MKKITILLILMIMIFSISCKKEASTSDTPPPFGAPPVERTVRAFTGTVPTGFGVPVDVFNAELPIIYEIPKLDADPSDTNIPTVAVKVNQEGGWIWNEGARYDWSTGTWVKFIFPQPTYGTTKWIKGSASLDLTNVPFNSVNIKENIPVEKQDPEGENLIVAFTCKRYSGEWRCGCSSTTETAPCAKWMARKYAVNTELPPITDPGMPPNLFPPPFPLSVKLTNPAPTTAMEVPPGTRNVQFEVSSGANANCEATLYGPVAAPGISTPLPPVTAGTPQTVSFTQTTDAKQLQDGQAYKFTTVCTSTGGTTVGSKVQMELKFRIQETKTITLIGYNTGASAATSTCRTQTSPSVTVSACNPCSPTGEPYCPTHIEMAAGQNSPICRLYDTNEVRANYVTFTLTKLPSEDGRLEIIGGHRTGCLLNDKAIPEQNTGCCTCAHQFPASIVPKTMFNVGTNTLICLAQGMGQYRHRGLRIAHLSFNILE